MKDRGNIYIMTIIVILLVLFLVLVILFGLQSCVPRRHGFIGGGGGGGLTPPSHGVQPAPDENYPGIQLPEDGQPSAQEENQPDTQNPEIEKPPVKDENQPGTNSPEADKNQSKDDIALPSNELPLGVYMDLVTNDDTIELLPERRVRFMTQCDFVDTSIVYPERRTFTGYYVYVSKDITGDPEAEECIVFYFEGYPEPVYFLYDVNEPSISSQATNFQYIGE